ncbi:MAG TPA: IS1 family transposase [Pyrinomonadaceae bacterium]|nr:IS1 family transposase [Pyrinomonadaceae bacterium]
MDIRQKKSRQMPADERVAGVGAYWVWTAISLPTRLRVTSHLSQERSASAATAFIQQIRARSDGRAPFFTSDKLPAYVTALVANYSVVEPPPTKRGRGRPRLTPKRIVDATLRYAQVDKRRHAGRVVEVRRRIIFGTAGDIEVILKASGCGSQINTAYVERNNLTMRQNVGRLVRKTLSFSKNVHYLQRHIALEDAVYNFVKPHRSLRRPLCESDDKRRQWEPRTPAMAAGLTDHVWSIEELLEFHD